jgi:threonine efflux protein
MILMKTDFRLDADPLARGIVTVAQSDSPPAEGSGFAIVALGIGLVFAKRPCTRNTVSMIPSLHQLLLVFTAYVIAAGSPGPSNMRIMAVAMNQGRQAALTFAAGVITGSIFWGLMAATGVSALLTRYARALIILKIFGGLYLLFLAFKAGRSALTSDEAAARSAPNEAVSSRLALYRRGLLMHLSNPKAILAWIALLTLGLGSKASPQSVVVILGGCFVLSVTIFCGYALVFSTAPMVRLYRSARRWIEGVLAGFFAFAGLRLLLSRT